VRTQRHPSEQKRSFCADFLRGGRQKEGTLDIRGKEASSVAKFKADPDKGGQARTDKKFASRCLEKAGQGYGVEKGKLRAARSKTLYLTGFKKGRPDRTRGKKAPHAML